MTEAGCLPLLHAEPTSKDNLSMYQLPEGNSVPSVSTVHERKTQACELIRDELKQSVGKGLKGKVNLNSKRNR